MPAIRTSRILVADGTGRPTKPSCAHTRWLREAMSMGVKSINPAGGALIEAREPDTWQDLEDQVTAIMNEAGFQARRNEPITTARGVVKVDVRALDTSVQPEMMTIFECKYWKSAVPQTVVHSFRAVVADSGAHLGLIVSRSGFQPGAEVAASFSNVELVNWSEFQRLFAERWYRNYMMDAAWAEIDRLVEYAEPLIGSNLGKKLDAISDARQQEFVALHYKYKASQDLQALFFKPLLQMFSPKSFVPTLPLRNAARFGNSTLPESILDAISLRELLEAVTAYARFALASFDEVLAEGT